MFRISFNNIVAKLVIRIMLICVHECHTNWYILVRDEWQLQNLLTLVQLRNIQMFTNNSQYPDIILCDFANSD
jgi:hypothetical protein